MRTILLDMTVCGFKCIDEPITIQFTNKTFNKSIYDSPQIKAIYGTNGEGKSALIHAIDVYIKTIFDDGYLTVQSANGALVEIINKNIKKAAVSLRYYVGLPSGEAGKIEYAICRHTINYVLDNDKKVYIEKETLSVSGNLLFTSNAEKKVFSVTKGVINYMDEDYFMGLGDFVKDRTKNLLEKSSLLHHLVFGSSVYADLTKKEKLKCSNLMAKALISALFAFSSRVFLDEKDSHVMNADKVRRIVKENKDNPILSEQSLTRRSNDIVVDNEIDEVEKEFIDDYKEEVEKICRFLKIFKPELDRIDVDESPIGDKIRCKKILVYKDGTPISSEYESSGIKKLMKLYPVLAVLENGGTAFIDEFDSNIHDVYLCKIIEYVLNYTKGQLIFTTHNLGPMEVLDKSGIKHSIDFINDSKISSWKRNGNYSVVKVYRGGAIPNCPFNIDAADFVKVFGQKRGK